MVLKPSETVFVNGEKSSVLVLVEVAGPLDNLKSIGLLPILAQLTIILILSNILQSGLLQHIVPSLLQF